MSVDAEEDAQGPGEEALLRFSPEEARRGGLVLAPPDEGLTPVLEAACRTLASEGYEVLALRTRWTGEARVDAEHVLRAAELLSGPLFLIGYGVGGEAAFEAFRARRFAAAALYDAPSPEALAAFVEGPLLLNLARAHPLASGPEAAGLSEERPDLKIFPYAAELGFGVREGAEDARALALLRVRQHFHRTLLGRERGA